MARQPYHINMELNSGTVCSVELKNDRELRLNKERMEWEREHPGEHWPVSITMCTTPMSCIIEAYSLEQAQRIAEFLAKEYKEGHSQAYQEWWDRMQVVVYDQEAENGHRN